MGGWSVCVDARSKIEAQKYGEGGVLVESRKWSRRCVPELPLLSPSSEVALQSEEQNAAIFGMSKQKDLAPRSCSSNKLRKTKTGSGGSSLDRLATQEYDKASALSNLEGEKAEAADRDLDDPQHLNLRWAKLPIANR